ncbi:MAG: multiheme c-type cytochrome [Myxococcota bacterium]|nr:multiheme c-type cytochrome [Myxococcota bacterium]
MLLRWSSGLARVILLSSCLIVTGASTLDHSRFVGPEKCGSCHEFAMSRWLDGPHSSALSSLSESERNNARCTSCHSPEDGLEIKVSKHLSSVTCESCHGAGRYYHQDYVMRDKELSKAVGLVLVEKAQCRRCHTLDSPSIEKFDYEEFWQRISHSKRDRLAWERSKGRNPAAE